MHGFARGRFLRVPASVVLCYIRFMILAEKLRRARARYKDSPTDRHLRYYLLLKAKAGKWDTRYCRYFGVSTDVSPAVKQFITRGYAMGLVPTSTTGGTHAPGSMHYSHRAADMGVRRPEAGTAKGNKKLVSFQRSEFTRRHKYRHVELIGPVNALVVLKGRVSPLPEHSVLEDQHDNHVHGGF